jgi:hypothetical protein
MGKEGQYLYENPLYIYIYISYNTARKVNHGYFNGLATKLGLNRKCIQNFGMGTCGKWSSGRLRKIRGCYENYLWEMGCELK